MRILQIVFLLSLCGFPQALSIAIGDILEIAKLSKRVVINVVKTFKLLDNNLWLLPKVTGPRVVFKRFKRFNNTINMLNAQMEEIGFEVLSAIAVSTGVRSQQKLELLEVRDTLNFIKSKYKQMGTIIENKVAYENETLYEWYEFGRSILLPRNTSLIRLLDRFHAIIAPSKDGVPSVFKILIEIMREEGNNMFCNMQTSGQQLLLNLYHTLAFARLKGFLMLEFCFMLHKLHTRENFTKDIRALRKQYKVRTATILKLTIEAVKSVPTEFWKCDPNKQVKDETYIEITELLQGYIENERDLNKEMACFNTCEDHQHTKSYYCFKDEVCTKHRRCKGEIINCQKIENGRVCLADAGTNRRYDFILDDYQNIFGSSNSSSCALSKSISVHHISWSMIDCHYCMCLCDEQGINSDRYFSMHSAESKVDDNMVVTGLRFLKKNRIIHLQIQEGKLLPNAKIEMATVRWKPVEDYKINKEDLPYGIDDRIGVDGQDYHTLTRRKRNFDLDDLVAKDDELLTGVRFRLICSHLNFQIRVTPFNLTTGKLMVGKSKWKHNEVLEKDRKMVIMKDKDIPIRSEDRALPLSKSGMYLEFTHTGLARDVAQTTVPFIDAQAVALALPVPISGAGVMYKGSEHFGGFIYPKIMTYDYSKLLSNAYDDTNFVRKAVNKK